MRNETILSGGICCWVMAAVYALGFFILSVKLEHVQLDASADAGVKLAAQSVRRVRTAGPRGRILTSDCRVLADNRPSLAIVLNAAFFECRRWDDMTTNILAAVTHAGEVLECTSSLTPRAIERHLRQSLARPLVVWDDVNEKTLARFVEHADVLPGFSVEESEKRVYPSGSRAAHLLGYVGCSNAEGPAGDGKVDYSDFEIRGRAGLEYYYDSFLRGVPGEETVQVDARGFSRVEGLVVAPTRGFDLVLTLDSVLQAATEDELKDCRGACVVLDPRDGAVLALASSPTFDPNRLLPVFDPNGFRPKLLAERYGAYEKDPTKPMLNRALGEGYAPGSTFKPITALAGLTAGASADDEYDCTGAYFLGEMRIRCARTWGHGPLDVTQALKESCNAYFCHLGMETGTNALMAAASAFGLGAPTGIDFPRDYRGVVPDETWKRNAYGVRWYPGDLAQMSIGQGMLLVTPLQMARVVAALGTGRLVTPYLKAGLAAPSRALPFSEKNLDIVRDGMRKVVAGGTGRRGGDGVAADVMGKTGTAEVGQGATRRKNTWFMAYATGNASSRAAARGRAVAVAMVIENGESGGGTTAPKVAAVLKAAFNATEEKGVPDAE